LDYLKKLEEEKINIFVSFAQDILVVKDAYRKIALNII
jgi:hypothetical protein